MGEWRETIRDGRERKYVRESRGGREREYKMGERD